MRHGNSSYNCTRYRTGEEVKWQGKPAIVTEGGFKFGKLTIECGHETIKLGPYDPIWPEKVFLP